MKKYLILLIVLVISSTSCNKFLDTKPTNFISPDYSTIGQLETGLAGVYDALGLIYSDTWPFWLNSTTDIYYNRTGQINSTVYVYSSADSYITNFWKYLYQGIYRANVLLDAIENVDLDEQKQNNVKGQALFLRAYFYFLLVSNFGDVPLMLSGSPSIVDLDIPRTPMKEVYEKIVTDMKEAEGLVEVAGQGGATFGGRISKSAVQGVLARVYLKMAGYPLNDKSKYADALEWGLKVYESGIHSLEADYREVFKKYARDEYNIEESIWEVEYYGNGTGNNQEYNYYTAGRIGILSGDPAIGTNSGLIFASKTLFDMYGTDPASTTTPKATLDIRRDWNIAPYGYTGNPAVKVANNDLFRRYAAKWRREYEKLTPKGNNISGQNFPILRYSDVLLMIAEAENALRGPADAAKYVNEVRRRAFGILYGNRIKSIVLTNGGSGYTSAPNVVVGGGGATATATVVDGVVTAINLDEPLPLTETGPYYTTPPAITISGGGGDGATAQAFLTSSEDADLTAEQTASSAAFLQVIKDERARELCYEATRRHDLIRWGNFVQDLRQFKADAIAMGAPAGMYSWVDNVSERTQLLPIPIYDMSLNKALVQNPGY